MEDELVANIGQFVIGETPSILTCLGLGSCVGVVLYQENHDVAGLMHVMLPFCPEGREDDSNIFKYADKGLPLMIDELCLRGCDKNLLKAKIVGGAHMFKDSNITLMDIGKRNIEAVLKVLENYRIKLVSKEIGGAVGRSMRFDISTYVVTVKSKDGVMTI